jgi:membrane-associated phospholipid phosphatase
MGLGPNPFPSDALSAPSRSARTTSPADRLALVTLGALAVLALVTDHAPAGPVLTIGAAIVFLVVMARWALHSSVGELVHRFVSPYVAVACAFELSGVVIDGADRGRWDASLTTLDGRYFPRLSAAWHGALGRPNWLTDAASVVYVGFYFLPLVLGWALHRQGRRRELDELVFVAEASFFLSYVGYALFPARGPRVPIAIEATLGGGPISAGVRTFIDSFEHNDVDAFPSGHTLVSLVLLALGWRYFPRMRAALVAVVAAIVFSTVYLSFHYVTDVVAGAIAALLVVVMDVLEGRRDVAHAPGTRRSAPTT